MAQEKNLPGLIQKYFPPDQWENAYKISMAESGGSNSAVGDTETQYPSYGIFQIRNLPGRPDTSKFSSEENVAYAANLYKSSGNWGDWYNSAKKLGLSGGGNKMITIKNAQTGETKQVNEGDLGQYGIKQNAPQMSSPQQQMQNLPSQAIAGQSGQFQNQALAPVVTEQNLQKGQQSLESGKLKLSQDEAQKNLSKDLTDNKMTLKSAINKYSALGMNADDVFKQYLSESPWGTPHEDIKQLQQMGVTEKALGNSGTAGSFMDLYNTKVAISQLRKLREQFNAISYKGPGSDQLSGDAAGYNTSKVIFGEPLGNSLVGSSKQGLTMRLLNSLPDPSDPTYMLNPGKADKQFRAAEETILGDKGYTYKDLGLPVVSGKAKNNGIMKTLTNMLPTIGQVGGSIGGGALAGAAGIETGPGALLTGAAGAAAGGAAGGAAGEALKQKIQGGKADLRKIGGSAGEGAITGAGGEVLGAGANIAGKGIMKTLGKMVPGASEAAANTFKSIFTVPTKRAKDLLPKETAQKMVDYGIAGSYQGLKKTAQSLTGRTGLLTKIVNDAVASLKTVNLPMTMIRESVGKLIDDSLEVSKTDKAGIFNNIKKLEKMETSGEVLDKLRQFQNLAHQYLNRSTYLTNDIRKQDIGEAYNAVAKHLSKAIDAAGKSEDIVSQFKTPEIIKELEGVSPKLAQEFKNAKTIKEVRSLEAPFVRLNKMIDLSEQQGISAAANWGKKLAGAGAGGALGSFLGPVGTGIGGSLGMVAEPALEAIGQPLQQQAMTNAAKLMSQGLPKGIGKAGKAIPPAIMNLLLNMTQQQQ